MAFWQSEIGKWVLGIPASVIVLYAGYFIVMTLCIRRCRRRMVDYGRFVQSTYGGDRVPDLIVRYYLREVETYNRLRDRRPFRTLWKEAKADRKVVGDDNRTENRQSNERYDRK